MFQLKTFMLSSQAFLQKNTSKGAKSQVPGHPSELNFIWWCLIFMGPQNGTSFMSPFWYLEF
jgi:hypothetical protein